MIPSNLSKREYFAALAMQALVTQNGDWTPIPDMAVKIADRLIAALNVRISEGWDDWRKREGVPD